MNDQLFHSKIFKVDGSKKCACIITGYRGRIAGYKRIIKILTDRGYSVIAYSHSHTFLTKSKPELLPTLVNQICEDFYKRSSEYEEAICVGVSIGAGLNFAVQSKNPKVKFGIYAGAGVSPFEAIYEAPLFYFIRKKFLNRGINKLKLKKAWSEVDISPDKKLASTPFIMALGKKDKIVNYDKALATLQSWQKQGQPIQIITKSRMGHTGIIFWYKKHFEELLTKAEHWVN